MKRIVAALALAVLVVIAGVLLYPRSAQPATVLEEIERARPQRLFPARLSVPTAHQNCHAVAVPQGGTVPREKCGERGDAPNAMVRLAGRGESLAPDTLHGSALVTVAWWDGTDAEALDAAIDRMNEALLSAGDSVPLLVDLSAAHLTRAQQEQSPQDLIRALNYAARAVIAEPGNLAARWNKALAATAMFLPDGAARAWNAYLQLDSTSPWAEEARGRLASLDESPAARHSTSSRAGAEPDSMAPYRPWDTLARWDTLLGEWGSAVLAGKQARADSLLSGAARQGDERDRWGEHSLTDAVQAIRQALAAADEREIRRLARAHRAYSAAMSSASPDSLSRVLELEPRSPALRAWADLHHELRTSGLGAREADALLARIDTLRYSLLTARVHWIRAHALIRSGQYAEAEIHARAAARTFGRYGVADGYAPNRSFEGWALFERGDTLTAYGYAHQGLMAAHRARLLLRMQALLVDQGRYAARQGMYHAALVIADQVNAIAREGNDTAKQAEAILTRVMLGRLTGETTPVSSSIDSAAALIAGLPNGPDTKRLENILRYTRAAQEPVGQMADSIAVGLDFAITQFSEDSEAWRVSALMRRADEHLHNEDEARAEADLDSITAAFRRTADNGRALYLRAAVMEEARTRFDQLVTLHLRAGRVREALRALDRGRVSLAPTAAAGPASGGRLAAARGESVVNFALIGDTVFIWTMRDTSVALHRQPVDAGSLRAAIEQANAALERPEREARAIPHLVRLYDLLIRPVSDRLMRDSTLVIIADGEVAGVPFAALRDTARGRFLVHDHPLRYAASLAEARSSGPPAPLDGGVKALLVADPHFDQDEYLWLHDLPGARGEIRSLLRLYPDADTLAGPAATVPALLARAQGVAVIHYAGHAVFDDTRPERSYLVLAGAGDSGRLSADSVTALDLAGVRIVVLSACSTLRGRRGRSGGFAGLSGAMLSAGAGGVVGSVWTVSDSLAQPLMRDFHQAYRSGDAARALHAAQLRMIEAGHGPSAWAGFRYMGR